MGKGACFKFNIFATSSCLNIKMSSGNGTRPYLRLGTHEHKLIMLVDAVHKKLLLDGFR
jgi:hypothetical protein